MKFFGFLFFTAILSASAFATEIDRITPKVAAERVENGTAVLVDVREPGEWQATGVAAPAVLLPKSDFDGPQKLWASFLAQNRDKELILYCHSGKRARAVAAALAGKGFKVANAGGFNEWQSAGLPTRKVGQKIP